MTSKPKKDSALTPEKTKNTPEVTPSTGTNGANGTGEATLEAKFQIAGDMTLFNVDLFGGYDSDSKCFIIKQLYTGQEDKNYTLTKFMDDLNKMLGKMELPTIPNDSLPPFLQDIMDNTAVYVREVYLKVAPDKSKGKTQSEYAIWAGITADKEKLDLPVTVNNLYLKVWKTNETQILENLKITNIEDVLALPAGDREEQQQPPDDADDSEDSADNTEEQNEQK